jgi:hypothetical protein
MVNFWNRLPISRYYVNEMTGSSSGMIFPILPLFLLDGSFVLMGAMPAISGFRGVGLLLLRFRCISLLLLRLLRFMGMDCVGLLGACGGILFLHLGRVLSEGIPLESP